MAVRLHCQAGGCYEKGWVKRAQMKRGKLCGFRATLCTLRPKLRPASVPIIPTHLRDAVRTVTIRISHLGSFEGTPTPYICAETPSKVKRGRCSLGTASTFDHVMPVLVIDVIVTLTPTALSRHRRFDRFVVHCPSSPLSSHLKSHTVRPPSPADATTARRVDTRHSNVTHDVHDTSPVGPSQGTTYCRTWILLCVESFRTPSYVPYPSFV